MFASRRKFLELSATISLLLAGGVATRFLMGQAFAESVADKDREYILLCDTDAKIVPHSYTNHPGRLKSWHVGSGDCRSLDLPLYGHIVNQSPLHAERVVTFEKWGTRGVLADIKQQDILTEIEASGDNVFLGHCAFNPDGSVMINTEGDVAATNGFLVLRDMATMKVIETYTSYGIRPHECRSPDQGKTIMVVNSGHNVEPSNICWIETASGRLLHKVDIPADDSLYAHFDVSYDGWVCATGVMANGGDAERCKRVTLIAPDGKVVSPSLPPDLVKHIEGEVLSIAFLGRSGLVAVTVPDSRMLLVFDYKRHRLVDMVPSIAVHGVLPALDAADDRRMIISLANSKSLATITEPKIGHGSVVPMPVPFGGSGAHLSRIYI